MMPNNAECDACHHDRCSVHTQETDKSGGSESRPETFSLTPRELSCARTMAETDIDNALLYAFRCGRSSGLQSALDAVHASTPQVDADSV